MQAFTKILLNRELDKEPVETWLVRTGVNTSEIYGETQMERAWMSALDSHEVRHMLTTVKESHRNLSSGLCNIFKMTSTHHIPRETSLNS